MGIRKIHTLLGSPAPALLGVMVESTMNKKLEEGCSGEQVVAFPGTYDFTMMQEEPSGVLAKYQRLYGDLYFRPSRVAGQI